MSRTVIKEFSWDKTYEVGVTDLDNLPPHVINTYIDAGYIDGPKSQESALDSLKSSMKATAETAEPSSGDEPGGFEVAYNEAVEKPRKRGRG